VTCTAGLAGLARETWQGVRRRCRADCEEQRNAKKGERSEQAAIAQDSIEALSNEALPLHRRVSDPQRA